MALFPLVVLLFAFGMQDEFCDLLTRNKMLFSSPKKYREAQVQKNSKMRYEKAFRHKRKNFEVRYAIRPFDKLFAEFKRSRKDSSFYIIDPNTFYETSFKVSLLNITNGKDYPYAIIDSAALKNQFNADWGAMAMVEPSNEFGAGYKYCLIIYIFKKDLGEAYSFYMGDDKKMISDLMAPISASIVFRKSE